MQEALIATLVGSSGLRVQFSTCYYGVAICTRRPPCSKPVGSQATANVANSPATFDDKSNPRVLPNRGYCHVLDLFPAGKSPAEIIFEAQGIKSNKGVTYQNALTEILKLLRVVVGRAAGLEGTG